MSKVKLSDRRLRLAATRRYPAGRIQLYVEWRDMWIGLYPAQNAIYLAVFMLVLRIATRPPPPGRGAWMLGLPDPQHIRPSELCAAFDRAGWTVASYNIPAYSRWARPGSDDRSPTIQVPHDSGAPEYAELVGTALAGLTASAAAGQHAETVLALLAGAMLSDPIGQEGTST